MVEDVRSGGSPDNNFGEIHAGDDSPVTVVSQRDEETLSVEMLIIDYGSSGSTPCNVTLFDEPEGTERSELSDEVAKFNMTSGEKFVVDNVTLRDIEDDLIAYTEGNNDGLVIVTAGGHPVTG